MLDTADYPRRLSVLLGLVSWRLRRDVAREAQTIIAPENGVRQPPELTGKPAPAAAALAANTGQAVSPGVPQDRCAPVELAGNIRVWAADRLTLISLPDYGTWWLPALSAGEAGMCLFRSAAEAEMLYTLLSAVGLDGLAVALQAVDAHFSSGGFLPRRLPPGREELLSLPKPWLLCGAIARQQGEAVAGEYAPSVLHHPLLLLANPRQKRSAWQQILAYKQVIHV